MESAWIMLAREEPESIADHVASIYGERLSRDVISAAVASYDPDYLMAMFVASDGSGPAHIVGEWAGALGWVRAVEERQGADGLAELWGEVVSIGDRMADRIDGGMWARSVAIGLDVILADGSTGVYLVHVAGLEGEQPRIPRMPRLSAEAFRAGVGLAPDSEIRIAASAAVGDNRRRIVRRLDLTRSPEMPEVEETTAAEATETTEAAAEATEVEASSNAEDDEDEELEAAAEGEGEAVKAASKPKRTIKAARSKARPSRIDRLEASQAELLETVRALTKQNADLLKANRLDAARTHARTLVASLPAGMQDGAADTLAKVADSKQREELAKLLTAASAVGVRRPVNVSEIVATGGNAIAEKDVIRAAQDLGYGLADLNVPAVREHVVARAAKLAAASKSKEVN